VHGLWPQYERSWPQFCETNETLAKPVIDKTLDIMPSPGLIRHEWSKHGVCAGGSADQYFDRARRAFRALKIPTAMQSPKKARTVAPAVIKNEFLAANPGMPADAVSVGCNGKCLRLLCNLCGRLRRFRGGGAILRFEVGQQRGVNAVAPAAIVSGFCDSNSVGGGTGSGLTTTRTGFAFSTAGGGGTTSGRFFRALSRFLRAR
jgi:Ribonuclease T2 family